VGQILTTKELAAYLKLTKVTVYKYLNNGEIPGFKVKGRWRFDKDRIDEVLSRKEIKNKENPLS
jgi:excisionase family DNA binding protein